MKKMAYLSFIHVLVGILPLLFLPSFSFPFSSIHAAPYSIRQEQAAAAADRPGLSRTVFDVRRYGAVPDGVTDNSQAFLRAWNDACRAKGKTAVRVPEGQYLVRTASFRGPCNGPMLFVIEGTLLAPTDPSKFFSDTWIAFQYVNDLDLRGARPGGLLHGRGAAAWKYNDCRTSSLCRSLPVSLRLDFVKNSRVHHLRLVDSKSTHIHLFGSSNVSIYKLSITAPAESPNTDGIRIGVSNHIAISDSYIGTGDDCISMISGSRDIDISGVTCGPGHGISIGSLGKTYNHEYVQRIHVTNSTLIDTNNGVRIKTWGSSGASLAANIIYDNIVMKDVKNPIIIDQHYCPSGTCPQGNSLVQLENVTFRNIQGTSATKVALNLQCSQARPCKNVKLINIDLWYGGKGGGRGRRVGKALASCSHVIGASFGIRNPGGCL